MHVYAGTGVAVAAFAVAGAYIRAQQAPSVTFHKDVEPILQKLSTSMSDRS